MKVLYIIDSLKGYGAENSLVHIALHFSKITPVFIQLGEINKLEEQLEKATIKVYSLNLNGDFNLAEKRISSIIKIENPSIIHSTLFRSDMISRRLKNQFPDILLVGSFVSNSYGKNRYRTLTTLSKIKLYSTQIRDRISTRKVDYFISNSKAIKKENIISLGITDNKVRVIYRGRNLNNYTKQDSIRTPLKRDLNIEDKIIFLNVARLDPGKGQMDLIIAFKEVADKYTNTILIIVGEGRFYNELAEQINNLKLNDKVLLLGYREDIPELLSIADYFVFPSYFEGLPGALIEAIISKTPTIVSDIPENIECLAKDGALVFEPGNIQELSSKMEEALNMNNWQLKIEASYNYAKENFDIAKVSLKYEKFYQEIINDSKPKIKKP